jgi:hypothetical protein
VGVLGRKQHGGEEHFIVRQPDGTLMLLPAWMTHPDAGAFRLIGTSNNSWFWRFCLS